MCWHMCNSCNEINNSDGEYGRNDTPCLWFIPGVDESGLRGCPYMIPREDNDIIDEASWVAITDKEAQKLMSRSAYHDDSPIDEEEHEYNQKYINSYLDGE